MSRLLSDDVTRLDMISRFGRKLRMFVKITERERLFWGVVGGQFLTLVLRDDSYEISFTVSDVVS